ncbi:MAG: calcium-binding protein [Lachnospiraceae bacterium]|nr:calcium-binding protein [Lachnospiraceae bacterium]
MSFEENISIEDLMMTRNGNNLEVSISDTTDKIILNDYFINSSYQNFTAEFADGSSLSQNDFRSIINGTYVYESALKQSELLVQSMASTSDNGNVSEMVNITTQDNNMTDTQLFVSNQ